MGDSMDKERIIFHVDVNNAFLSWTAVKLLEEGYETDIRNIPSVIGGDETKRHGIVLAKSPVAKKMGIKTAETLYSARGKCKNLLIFPPDFKFYKKKSNELFSFLSTLTPDIEIFSIDECFLDLTNTNYLYKDYVSLAYKIKNEIYNKYGFSVNVGIGNNKLCAKMASDFEKPNKVHTLYLNEIERKMWPLDVGELFMVGKKTAEKLKRLGINTIGELANSDVGFLRKHFKNQAQFMWEYANGIDTSPVVSSFSAYKCISVSQTFEEDVSDIERLKATLLTQSQNVGKRLRLQNMYANTIAITMKTFDFKQMSKQMKLNIPINSTNNIYENAIKLLNEFWDGTKIRNIGIRLNNFTDKCCEQASLFEASCQEDNMVNKILDEINDKFGNSSVLLAATFKDKKEDSNE